MARSLKKSPFIDQKLLKKISKFKSGAKIEIKTYSRDSMIIPEMVDLIIHVHQGKTFIPVKIREEMIGHRLGEFAPTRRFIKHGGKIQRELEKKAGTKE